MPNRVNCLSSLVILFIALASLGLAAPAQAEPTSVGPAHAWSSSTVCVVSHVGKEWDVKGAIRRWNHLDGGPTFVLESSCADYDGTVTVRYQSSSSRYTGWSKWYWDAAGYIVHADVTVNPHRIRAFASRDRSCQRKHTITHELGHALGLRHYPHAHAGSVMSYLGWQRLCGGLSAHDSSDYHDLYPVPTA
jgi:predicted Zn-dependent protease